VNSALYVTVEVVGIGLRYFIMKGPETCRGKVTIVSHIVSAFGLYLK
jgi:hypothetical protein